MTLKAQKILGIRMEGVGMKKEWLKKIFGGIFLVP
jgi:hypothetical protein